MFYRIKSDYILRGWEMMPWVLVRRKDNKTRNISKDMFQVLLLCDGETDLTKVMLNNTLQDILNQCENEGIIERSHIRQPLKKEQYYRYFNNRFVEAVLWSVTGKCNFRCRHCFMDAPKGMLGELSTEDALKLIDQMAACGVLRVNLTGGEPFVRKDFWQLVDHILSHKMVIGKIYTNGWLLDEQMLDKFACRNMKPQISISFDGVGWHDWMRGIKGAEQTVLNALALCQSRGLDTDVEMCIHRGNIDSLSQTIQVLSKLGVKSLKVSNVAQTELWKKQSEGNALTNQEYLDAMIEFIPEYFKKKMDIELILCNVIVLKGEKHYKIVAETYDGTEKCLDSHLCSGARWNCYVTPEGRLLPCMPMTSSFQQNFFPKINEIGLKKGLSDSYYMRFVNRRVKDLFSANKECGNCPHRNKCGGGCRASALIEGDHELMGCDRTMCMLWKEGYVDRIRQIVEECNSKGTGKFIS